VPPRGDAEKSAERVSRDELAAEALDARTDGSSSVDDADALSGDKKDMGASMRNVASKASGSARAAFGAVGPAVSRFGARAKGAVTGLLETIRKRREATTDQQEDGQTFRRTTSAPPTGALRAAGRKLIRDREEGETTEPAVKAVARRKAAMMGGALGLVAVLAVVGGARLLGSRTAATTDSQSPEANGSVAAASLPAPVASGQTGDATGTPVANVPLFGATPLSTTETVPAMPTQPDGTVAPSPAAAADPNAAEPAANEAGSNEEDDSDGAAQGNGKQFGHGSVRSPIVLKIKTDGDIETVNGAAGAMGFTISLPGRHAKSSSAELMRKDKRIASLNIVNNPTGSEISIQFKDGVPAYIAKAKGNRLDISLGTSSKKVAKSGTSKSKKSSKKSTKKSTKKTTKKP
jgi:hypothetical protein